MEQWKLCTLNRHHFAYVTPLNRLIVAGDASKQNQLLRHYVKKSWQLQYIAESNSKKVILSLPGLPVNKTKHLGMQIFFTSIYKRKFRNQDQELRYMSQPV